MTARRSAADAMAEISSSGETRDRALIEALIARVPALVRLGRLPEAAKTEERVLSLAGGDAGVLFDYALALHSAGLSAQAATAYARVIERNPRIAAVWANLSKALLDSGQPDPALHAAEVAVDVDPAFARGHAQHGLVLREFGRIAEAIEAFDRAAALDPDGVTLCNRAVCRLGAGDLPGGFADHERRRDIEPTRSQIRRFRAPLWLGAEPLAGKTILLHAEQGFGDTIQFCRYATLAAEQGARVLLQVPSPLVELMRSLKGVDAVLSEKDSLPAFDLQCPLMSLPLAFGTTLATIPAAESYLQPPARSVSAWAERLGARAGSRVGIAWFGNPTHNNDRQRSLPLTRLVQALPPAAEIFSLHNRARPEDGEALAARPDIRRFEAALDSFAETAALAAHMDLVIAVDTSVAHVAAATGRPTWILLPYAPDWRWLLDREDSPWYPSARLFRQPRPGDWEPVLARVRSEAGAKLAR